MQINLTINNVLDWAKQLPIEQIIQLKTALDIHVQTQRLEKTQQQDDLGELLLNGPVMSDEQYAVFLENRKYFGKWRSL